ncbi:2-succinyl-6-hydroxy-2,4-cyclohexadiene-1-carboxylate synthase [Paraconexibacter sp. AEG42_29]|uniref:2-succinyl-6-hydroxy-2, 4-cyclohexadiene-1-carboxylate synthase n=1 Tax=Paraconexibacter sp. AEG42_29 TaxID=2997339 RepID=A0AAU7B0N4_9ACTN
MTDHREDVTVDGHRIEVVRLDGDTRRAALVLLHEGLGSVGLWRGFPASLQAATGRRLIIYSRFGHGRSAPPPQPRTPAFFGEEAHNVLPKLLAECGVERPILIGHSDGGSIALVHAAAHAVGGIVLIAPHVVVEDMTITAIEEVRDVFRGGRLRERMTRHHDDPDAAFWGWCDVWLDPAFRAFNLQADAENVSAPTLLIQGAEDPYGTLDQLDRIQSRVRGPVERLVVPGGHSPHLEQPAAVVERIAAFTAELA